MTEILFKWSHKGKTREGNTATFSGEVWAINGGAAATNIDKMMRKEWPDIKWMHGKKIETEKVRFGPTVWATKQTREK